MKMQLLLPILILGFANALGFAQGPQSEYPLPEMVHVPGNVFVMGENDISAGQTPEFAAEPLDSYLEHEVQLSSFYMSRHEVTFRQFISFVEATGFQTANQRRSALDDFWGLFSEVLDYPVVFVSYEEALAYCRWLSDLTGETYRLPTEAEWEYAATGGQSQRFPWGENYVRLVETAHAQGHSRGAIQERFYRVGEIEKDVSPSGVYGMYGNVREYVLDYWHPSFYERSPSINPLNLDPLVEGEIVVRGESTYGFEDDLIGVRYRNRTGSHTGHDDIGFRVVREPTQTIFNSDGEYPSVYAPRNARNLSNDSIPLLDQIGGEKTASVASGHRLLLRFWVQTGSSNPNTQSVWVFGVSEASETGWVLEKSVQIVDEG